VLALAAQITPAHSRGSRRHPAYPATTRPYAGLIGYSLNAQLLRKTLEQFARTDPHHGDTDKVRPAMLPTTFVFWSARADDLPIGWDEVRRRIDEERSKSAGG
jgi:hypothetical protein